MAQGKIGLDQTRVKQLQHLAKRAGVSMAEFMDEVIREKWEYKYLPDFVVRTMPHSRKNVRIWIGMKGATPAFMSDEEAAALYAHIRTVLKGNSRKITLGHGIIFYRQGTGFNLTFGSVSRSMTRSVAEDFAALLREVVAEALNKPLPERRRYSVEQALALLEDTEIEPTA